MTSIPAAFLDANVILRYLLNDVPDMAERSRALFAEAAAGKVQLILSPLIVGECVWVMKSFYKKPLTAITAALLGLMELEGVSTEQPDFVRAALHLSGTKNVDFADAFLTVQANEISGQIATFDQDFKRLGVALLAF